MICHVCHQEAVGQCKNCMRFYCAAHGNIQCVECRGVQNDPPPPARAERPYVAPSVVYTGPACYACKRPAHRACPRCGSFYCEEHGPVTCGGSRCQACSTFETVWGCIVFVVMGVIMLFVFANLRR